MDSKVTTKSETLLLISPASRLWIVKAAPRGYRCLGRLIKVNFVTLYLILSMSQKNICSTVHKHVHTDGPLHNKIDLTHGDSPVNSVLAKSPNNMLLKCPICILSGVKTNLQNHRWKHSKHIYNPSRKHFSFKEQTRFLCYIIFPVINQGDTTTPCNAFLLF